MIATVLMTLLFTNEAQAAADCTPCAGTIVYSGGSCFCYIKLKPDDITLDPLPEDDPDIIFGAEVQTGLDMFGFCEPHPEDEILGHIYIDDEWVQVTGESMDILDYWMSLNEE